MTTLRLGKKRKGWGRENREIEMMTNNKGEAKWDQLIMTDPVQAVPNICFHTDCVISCLLIRTLWFVACSAVLRLRDNKAKKKSPSISTNCKTQDVVMLQKCL